MTEFYPHGNGYRTHCKLCWAAKNREKYTGERREKTLARGKKHRAENREYYVQYRKEYYEDNKTAALDKARQRYFSVGGRAAALFNSAKRRAEQIGLEFSLTLARIEVSLLSGACERTKIPFDFTPSDKTWRNPHSPSIDRIDSFKGYTDDNIKVVVSMYNYGKGQHTDAEFIAFCHAVAANNPKELL